MCYISEVLHKKLLCKELHNANVAKRENIMQMQNFLK